MRQTENQRDEHYRAGKPKVEAAPPDRSVCPPQIHWHQLPARQSRVCISPCSLLSVFSLFSGLPPLRLRFRRCEHGTSRLQSPRTGVHLRYQFQRV